MLPACRVLKDSLHWIGSKLWKRPFQKTFAKTIVFRFVYMWKNHRFVYMWKNHDWCVWIMYSHHTILNSPC